MLSKTIDAFRNRTVYTQVEPGRWRAEFHGAVDVTVEGPSLERCRLRALDALDEQLRDWIVRPDEATP